MPARPLRLIPAAAAMLLAVADPAGAVSAIPTASPYPPPQRTPTPAPTATATTVPTATPTPPPAPAVRGRLVAPREVAPGGRLRVRVTGLPRPVRVQVRAGGRWRTRGRTGRDGRLTLRAPATPRRLTLRGLGGDGSRTPAKRVRVRWLRLSAVGDVNLGDGPGQQIARFGAAWPWRSAGPALRAADLAMANLECAVAFGGAPWSKLYTFRGSPTALPAMRDAGGIDLVGLANNHALDYGRPAFTDGLRSLRRAGIGAFGGGVDAAAASSPLVRTRLGLRVAFVGFSEILPIEFRAAAHRSGTAWADPAAVRRGVRRAARRADVVVVTFHWGTERDGTESAHQRDLARLALRAGATAVIGAHPHVLQPIRRSGRRLVAYSLGNFVFAANSPGTTRTGVLELRLGRRRVASWHLRRATIEGTRPVLDRPFRGR